MGEVARALRAPGARHLRSVARDLALRPCECSRARHRLVSTRRANEVRSSLLSTISRNRFYSRDDRQLRAIDPFRLSPASHQKPVAGVRWVHRCGPLRSCGQRRSDEALCRDLWVGLLARESALSRRRFRRQLWLRSCCSLRSRADRKRSDNTFQHARGALKAARNAVKAYASKPNGRRHGFAPARAVAHRQAIRWNYSRRAPLPGASNQWVASRLLSAMICFLGTAHKTLSPCSLTSTGH